MFLTLEQDREYLENKYHKLSEPFNPYNRMAYHGYEYDPETGLDDAQIAEGLCELFNRLQGLPHPVIKAKMVAYVLDHTRIDINEHDYFPGLYTWNRAIGAYTTSKWYDEVFREKLPEENKAMQDLNASYAVLMGPDFDHVVPDWKSVMELGFPGLLQRARDYRNRHEKAGTLTDEQTAFFDGIEIEYTAIIRFIDRLYQYARKQKHEKAARVAQCLLHLRDGAPTDFYEALQIIFLYFIISESVDMYQVRSLGNGLDGTLYPFYQSDISSGRFTENEIKELLGYFLMQWSAIGNYWGQPFYLGGTNADGSSKINQLSHDIIDVYDALGIYNPKIQIKVNGNTPVDFLNKVLDMIRRGHSSVVFCCEPGMTRAMMRYGATCEEARTADISGCYETKVRANEVSTAIGYVNALKPIVYVFSNGYDEVIGRQLGPKTGDVSELKSFEQFYNAVLTQWTYLIDQTVEIANAFEQYLGYINPSSMYSATVVPSLERARDGYQDGVKYNNSEILNCGLASLVDSVMAVKELVFDRKIITLPELKAALDSNWEGYELLRLKARNCKHKYGNGDPEADRYAQALSGWFCSRVGGRRNARGGVYKAQLHSAMSFVWQGQHTGATPDGRRAGEEISKNASPVVGMDRNGVTALVKSATGLDPYTYTEGFCLDILLHPSAAAGEEGLTAMRAILDTYMKNGGMSIQFNVFDTARLRDAQQNPERYQNLQVRVCGWNVLWNNLSRKEQDAYILRAENV